MLEDPKLVRTPRTSQTRRSYALFVFGCMITRVRGRTSRKGFTKEKNLKSLLYIYIYIYIYVCVCVCVCVVRQQSFL